MPTTTGTHPTPDLPELLTCDEVAALTRKHPRTVRSWISGGEIPIVRLGGCVYVTRAALAAWLDAKAVPATSGPLAGRTS